MDFNDAIKDFTILTVDDKKINLYVLEGILQGKNYNVIKALGGEEAIECLKTEKVDLILLDVMMPGLDGFETADLILKDPKLKDIPIIYLTALNDKESVVEGFKHGAADYLSKPFDVNELLARVETQLKLKFQSDQLTQMNQVLDQKVKQRTAQLEEKSEELEIAYQNLSKAYRDLNGLDQVKNDFLRIISHEIRTPLNAIIGSVALMEDFLSQHKEVHDYLDLLKDGTDRMERFSEITLLLTELQTNRYKAKLENEFLRSFFVEATAKLKESLDAKDLNLSIHIHEKQEVQVDRKLFHKLIYSIVRNAIEHSVDGGDITITSIIQPDTLKIQIRDYGDGFSETALINLFKPFSVGDTPVDQSLGLSLKTAKLIMELHKGNIFVKNRSKGAEISLVLPHKL
ncbi:MAG: response regulator [Bacteroidales bacterium]|nr:response regulator [Bacteroidales bacterium]